MLKYIGYGMIAVGVFMILTSCTISVNQVHSEGVSEDAVDTDQKADANVSPTVNIPVKPL